LLADAHDFRDAHVGAEFFHVGALRNQIVIERPNEHQSDVGEFLEQAFGKPLRFCRHFAHHEFDAAGFEIVVVNTDVELDGLHIETARTERRAQAFSERGRSVQCYTLFSDATLVGLVRVRLGHALAPFIASLAVLA
jgi:hypothetical protein